MIRVLVDMWRFAMCAGVMFSAEELTVLEVGFAAVRQMDDVVCATP